MSEVHLFLENIFEFLIRMIKKYSRFFRIQISLWLKIAKSRLKQTAARNNEGKKRKLREKEREKKREIFKVQKERREEDE